jgi:RimJ/RimL family protein N-acetyltransferase
MGDVRGVLIRIGARTNQGVGGDAHGAIGHESAPMSAPAFDTERLILRPHVLEDFRYCAEMWSDPEVTRHITGKPSTDEETWTRLLRYVGHWSVLGFGYWTIRERSSGRFVGEAGFADYKREIEPSFNGAPEGGWVLAPWAYGQGFATEAVRGMLGWAAAHFGPTRTVCMISPENTASLRVAAKCGYEERGRALYKGHPSIVFDHYLGASAVER